MLFLPYQGSQHLHRIVQPLPPRCLVLVLYLNDSVPNITSLTMVSVFLGLFCITSWLAT